jgi:hypothetical protein
MSVDEIVSLLSEEIDSERMVKTDEYRLVTLRQKGLRTEEKWNVFFTAPPIYFDLTANEDMVRLDDEVANVSYGVKSGANDFFYRNTEKFEDLGIKKYTVPLLKATGQLGKVNFTADEADEWACLDVHDLVEQAEKDRGSELASGHQDPSTQVKEWAKDNGHPLLAEYISWGEQQQYHERSTCESRDVWFDLGELPQPSMLHTQFTWREHRVIWNEAKATATNQFHCIEANHDVPPRVLAGVLNSRVVWLVKELISRRTPGEDMTRLQTMVYETGLLLVANPRKMTDNEQEAIEAAFETFVDIEDGDGPTDKSKEDARADLDRAVLATLGLEDRFEELKLAVQNMIEAREHGAGKHTEVIVSQSQPSEKEVIGLAGVSATQESATLDDFNSG